MSKDNKDSGKKEMARKSHSEKRHGQRLGACAECRKIIKELRCGTEDTEKYIYEDEECKFSVEIPSDWTCESMYGPDSQEYDLPEAGMEIYMADDKENLIEVVHMHGKVTWHEAYDTSVIQLGDDLKGLLVEEKIEKAGESYMLVGVVIRDFYYIYMELPEDVYRDNKSEIDDVIRSFEILR